MPLVDTTANMSAIARAKVSKQYPLTAYTRAQTEYLDMVRGVAAQLVLLQHCADTYHPFPLPGQFGNLGVTLFFLLSGFLITDSIRARTLIGTFSLTEFMVSRFTRIFLPYVPAILFVAVLDSYSVTKPLYAYGTHFNWETAAANFFMLQDFSLFQLLRRLHVPDQTWFFGEFGSARQFWTISIEWWIYVTVGIGTAFVCSRRINKWLLVLLCISAVETLYNFVGGPGNSLTGYWILGAVASVLYRHAHSPTPSKRLLVVAWLGLLALAVLRLLYNGFQVYDMIFVIILCPLLFIPVYVYRSRPGPSVFHRVRLDRLAFHSYSLYLIHAPIVVLIFLTTRNQFSGWTGFVGSIVVSNLIALPFAFAFERPQKKVRVYLLNWLKNHGIPGPPRGRAPFPGQSMGLPN